MKNLLTAAIIAFLPITAVAAADMNMGPARSAPTGATFVSAVVPVATSTALTPIGSLTKNSDYTQFLRPGVPLELHQQAMRKLWETHPEFMQGAGATGDSY